jgi:protein translocase SEC61 complex gamma subunit
MNLNPVPKIRQFWSDASRILSISYKPGVNEFKRTLKIVLLGTLALGIVGYIIYLIVELAINF